METEEKEDRKLLIYFGKKGNSYLMNTINEIKILVNKHKPTVFGLGETNTTSDQDLKNLQLTDYNLHLPSSIDDPNKRKARVAVYTNKRLNVRRREDLEDTETDALFSEGGYPDKRRRSG